MRSYVLERDAMKMCTLQPTGQMIARDFEIVNRIPREQSVSDVKCLRYTVEGERDQSLFDGSSFLNSIWPTIRWCIQWMTALGRLKTEQHTLSICCLLL